MVASEKYILFQLGKQKFALDVQHVISIEKLQPITGVPHSKSYVKGITPIRDEPTPIIDMRERLRLQTVEDTEDTRILVVSLEGMQVGLIVDDVQDIRDIAGENINAAPAIISDVRNIFLDGIVLLDEELILVLNLDKILDVEETNELKDLVMN